MEEQRPGRALSPSRAADFLTCPLLYRFRVIDRLPEPPSPAAARGTLVHAVLERLFDEPAADRTPQTARGLLAPQWERLLAEEPELAGLFDDDEQRGAWLAEAPRHAGPLLHPGGSDPARAAAPGARGARRCSSPACCCAATSTGSTWRPTARSGSSTTRPAPRPRRSTRPRALFQMKFYAVVLWRQRGGAAAAAAHVPGQRRDRTVRAGRVRPARHGAQDRRAVAGDRAGRRRGRLAAAAEPALRLVRAPGASARPSAAPRRPSPQGRSQRRRQPTPPGAAARPRRCRTRRRRLAPEPGAGGTGRGAAAGQEIPCWRRISSTSLRSSSTADWAAPRLRPLAAAATGSRSAAGGLRVPSARRPLAVLPSALPVRAPPLRARLAGTSRGHVLAGPARAAAAAARRSQEDQPGAGRRGPGRPRSRARTRTEANCTTAEPIRPTR